MKRSLPVGVTPTMIPPGAVCRSDASTPGLPALPVTAHSPPHSSAQQADPHSGATRPLLSPVAGASQREQWNILLFHLAQPIQQRQVMPRSPQVQPRRPNR